MELSKDFMSKNSKFKSPINMNQVLLSLSVQKAKIVDESIKLYCIKTNSNPSEIKIIQKLGENESVYYLQNKNKNLSKCSFVISLSKNRIATERILMKLTMI